MRIIEVAPSGSSMSTSLPAPNPAGGPFVVEDEGFGPLGGEVESWKQALADLPVAEVAAVLGVAEGTVKRYLSEAMSHVAVRLSSAESG